MVGYNVVVVVVDRILMLMGMAIHVRRGAFSPAPAALRPRFCAAADPGQDDEWVAACEASDGHPGSRQTQSNVVRSRGRKPSNGDQGRHLSTRPFKKHWNFDGRRCGGGRRRFGRVTAEPIALFHREPMATFSHGRTTITSIIGLKITQEHHQQDQQGVRQATEARQVGRV